ncbi:antitoxin VapB family protein [Candidatus Woesearchaeota archaeon]|nr:antitoxin VapB family protein [Candidatus Woesearchaeota archaeon]
MAVKTITVTREAYEALKLMKIPNESFSRVLLRISGKRRLSDFAGILSKSAADRMESAMVEGKRRRNEAYGKRIKMVLEAFHSRQNGGS